MGFAVCVQPTSCAGSSVFEGAWGLDMSSSMLGVLQIFVWILRIQKQGIFHRSESVQLIVVHIADILDEHVHGSQVVSLQPNL